MIICILFSFDWISRKLNGRDQIIQSWNSNLWPSFQPFPSNGVIFWKSCKEYVVVHLACFLSLKVFFLWQILGGGYKLMLCFVESDEKFVCPPKIKALTIAINSDLPTLQMLHSEQKWWNKKSVKIKKLVSLLLRTFQLNIWPPKGL